MTTVHATPTINATREQIRPMFFDAARLLERDKNLIRYEPDPDWPRVGAKLASTFKTFLMEVNQVGTCVGYNPDTMRLEFTTESEQAPRPGRWLYTFDEQDGRTTVSLTMVKSAGVAVPMKASSWVMAPAVLSGLPGWPGAGSTVMRPRQG